MKFPFTRKKLWYFENSLGGEEFPSTLIHQISRLIDWFSIKCLPISMLWILCVCKPQSRILGTYERNRTKPHIYVLAHVKIISCVEHSDEKKLVLKSNSCSIHACLTHQIGYLNYRSSKAKEKRKKQQQPQNTHQLNILSRTSLFVSFHFII